jgi:para-nitrobenzyl esterase
MLFAGAGVVAALPADAYTAEPAVVATDNGSVRGAVTATGVAFKGIPYAAPPVGDLRWHAPQPAAKWSDTRDATKFAAECAQEAFPALNQPRITDEDCLYVNVYKPGGRVHDLPVMVWLHGGAFVQGSGNQFDGSSLAAQGVMVVTVNYRLGAFGFLGLTGLSQAAPDVKSGNYGLLDQQAALRWVQANAAAFGGDRQRVTVFGQSAGAESICAHLASPQSEGLFSRAILQSGPCGLVSTPLSKAEANGGKLAATAKCSGTDEVACMNKLSAAEVLDAVKNTDEVNGPEQVWGPTVGTPVLPTAPQQAISSGTYHKVPVVVGATANEGTVVVLIGFAGTPINEQTYPAILAGVFGGMAANIQREYPVASFQNNYGSALSAIMGDSTIDCPAFGMSMSFAQSTPTFAYEFADTTAPSIFPTPPDFPLGAYHGADALYLTSALPLNATQKKLSSTMLRYWTNFAKAPQADPNGRRTPQWQPFSAQAPSTLELATESVTNKTDFVARHHCAFWANPMAG